MSRRGMILCFAGVFLAASAALALGASFSTLLLVALSLLCPAAMFVGMRSTGSGHACSHSAKVSRSDRRDSGPNMQKAS